MSERWTSHEMGNNSSQDHTIGLSSCGTLRRVNASPSLQIGKFHIVSNSIQMRIDNTYSLQDAMIRRFPAGIPDLETFARYDQKAYFEGSALTTKNR